MFKGILSQAAPTAAWWAMGYLKGDHGSNLSVTLSESLGAAPCLSPSSRSPSGRLCPLPSHRKAGASCSAASAPGCQSHSFRACRRHCHDCPPLPRHRTCSPLSAVLEGCRRTAQVSAAASQAALRPCDQGEALSLSGPLLSGPEDGR